MGKMVQVNLQSQDGQLFLVDIEVARHFNVIKQMYDLKVGEDSGAAKQGEIIPIPNVNGETLKKVIEWVEYHKDDPKRGDAEGGKTAVEINAWNEKFVEVDQVTLFELIKAANFCDIEGLLSFCCCKVASMIQGKSPEGIRQTFNIQNDFDKDEEEQVQQENNWVEGKDEK